MALLELVLIRHGESVGNVQATAAMRAGAEVIDVGERDADVPLSFTGRQQALALGRVLAADQIDAAWCSPYLRALQTAAEAGLGGTEGEPPMHVDERLRDRELGILDLLTPVGVHARFPAEEARRSWLGKFYYRPPGGESWADVALRLRSLLADVERAGAERVALICHDAVVLLLRYVCEGLTERELLDLASSTSVLNGSITRLVRASASGPWHAATFNAVEHLAEAGVPVTEHAGDDHVHPE